MAHPLRHMAAGAQTLRFVTAVVCSVGVTSAVAGPMAWQAVEYRRDQAGAAVIAVEASNSEVGVSARASTQPPARAASTSAPAPPATTTSSPTTTVAPTTAPTVPESIAVPEPSLAATTAPTAPTAELVPAVPAPATTAPLVVPTVTSVIAVEAPVPEVPATSAPVTTTNPGLGEFDPRAACEDRAHELGVEVPPDCPPTPG